MSTAALLLLWDRACTLLATRSVCWHQLLSEFHGAGQQALAFEVHARIASSKRITHCAGSTHTTQGECGRRP